MKRILAYLVMWAAGVGVLASFVFYAISFQQGSAFNQRAVGIIFPGIFLVWVPTILLMNTLNGDFKQKDLWKAALRGCPPWMRNAMKAVIASAFAGFVIPLLQSQGGHVKSPEGFLIFPATFYSISFCTAYSFLHVDQLDFARKCLNGHHVSPSAKFCEECGAPLAEPMGRNSPSL